MTTKRGFYYKEGTDDRLLSRSDYRQTSDRSFSLSRHPFDFSIVLNNSKRISPVTSPLCKQLAPVSRPFIVFVESQLQSVPPSDSQIRQMHVNDGQCRRNAIGFVQRFRGESSPRPSNPSIDFRLALQPSTIIYNGNGKTSESIQLAVESGVLLNVDSLFDLEEISSSRPSAEEDRQRSHSRQSDSER